MPRSHGASAIYAFGYADLAGLFGTSPWDVAAAVVDGFLEPLHLIEIIFARMHGLEAICSLPDHDRVLWQSFETRRPRVIRETRTARVSVVERPYGLGDLWGYTTFDLASFCDLSVENMHTRASRGHVDMTEIASIVDFAESMMPERKLARIKAKPGLKN